MEIDDNKRITVSELSNMPYFKRLLKREPIYNTLHLNTNPGIHGSAYDLRMRSPSYNAGDGNNKIMKSEQVAHKRKVSVEKSSEEHCTSPFLLQTANNPSSIPPLSPYEKPKPSYSPSPQFHKGGLDVPRD